MRRFIIILAVVFLAAGFAAAEITASLEVVVGQDVSAGPYRQARLAVTNPAGTEVETVLLKPAGVGLTVCYDMTVPPGVTGRRIVFLPAISPSQEYSLAACDASGAAVARTSASITWPAELVTADVFIDDAFRAWTDEPARWPAKGRWNYLLILAMFVTAAVAALLIPGPVLRVAAVVVISAAAVALIVFVAIPAGSEAVQVHRYELFLHDGFGGFDLDSFAVVSARRTTAWSYKAAALPYPVYPDHNAAVGDDTVAAPASSSIRLTLRPGQVRIVRPGSSRLKPVRLWRGTLRWADNGFAIQTGYIREGMMLIRNDSIWLAGSAPAGPKASIRIDQAESYWAFMSGPGGRKMDRHTRRLLDYWRNKHQRGGKVYLMELHSSPAGTGINVVQLEEVSAW